MDPQAVHLTMQLCKRWEGFSATPYLCPAGVPTIGYGFTHYPNGMSVSLSDPPMTREHAERMLRWFIVNKYMPETLRLCPTIGTPGNLAAITDFTFNLGSGNLRASTLRRRILANQWSDVPTQLRRWVNAGGKRLRGLVARREAEISVLD